MLQQQKRFRRAAAAILAVSTLAATSLAPQAMAAPGHHESNYGEHHSKFSWNNITLAVKKNLIKPVIDIIGGVTGGGSGSVCK